MEPRDWVGRPSRGRTYQDSRLIRLGDAGAEGTLRLDGLARFLQDVANEDWMEAEGPDEDTWVVRRTRLLRHGRRDWPRLGDRVTLTTWCGGFGPAWAERRSQVEDGTGLLCDALSLWVPVGPAGTPRRLRESFFAIYGEAAAGRKVSGRVTVRPLDPSAPRQSWQVRRADLDVVGHVNNAAVWQAVAEVAPHDLEEIEVTHHRSLEWGEPTWLAVADDGAWIGSGDEVRVAVEWRR